MPVPAVTALVAKLAVAAMATATTTAGFVIASSAVQPVDATEDPTETLTAEPLDQLDAPPVDSIAPPVEPSSPPATDQATDESSSDEPNGASTVSLRAEEHADHGVGEEQRSQTATDVHAVIDTTPPEERGREFGQEVASAARGDDGERGTHGASNPGEGNGRQRASR